jgi:hypothetical protein
MPAAALGAERDADADLARPAGHHRRGDAVDPNRREQQSDDAQATGERNSTAYVWRWPTRVVERRFLGELIELARRQLLLPAVRQISLRRRAEL